MMKLNTTLGTAVFGALLHLSPALAANPTDYQVTGPILEVSDSIIAVQKGKQRWELSRDANTKVAGDLRVGAKVTIHYTMTAKNIEVKDEKAAASSEKPAANKEKKK
ncbi:MAG: hypothetical protein ACR2OZ_20130 [Verrucomicrobiales bacterium]